MEEHLNACPECAREVNALQEQAMALRALRPPAGLEPRPGFYARVIQRIEETRVVNTVWAAFLDPIFARRIVYGCATLVVILGTYMISTESGNRTVAPLSAPAITATATQAAAVRDDNYATPQERDAVLVTLAAYHE
jgi:anti-sigma factor RsiW